LLRDILEGRMKYRSIGRKRSNMMSDVVVKKSIWSYQKRGCSKIKWADK